MSNSQERTFNFDNVKSVEELSKTEFLEGLIEEITLRIEEEPGDALTKGRVIRLLSQIQSDYINHKEWSKAGNKSGSRRKGEMFLGWVEYANSGGDLTDFRKYEEFCIEFGHSNFSPSYFRKERKKLIAKKKELGL